MNLNLSLDKFEDKFIDHADVLAFLYQLTEKDIRYSMSIGQWGSLTLQTKLQFIANILGGRTVGFTPFPNTNSFAPTFILGNLVNKTSIAGAIIWGAAEIGIIPAKYGKTGQKILWGGAIGGVFDAPAQPPGAGNPTPTGRVIGPGQPAGIVAPAAQTAGGNYFGK
jgi:hypothetical protein